LQSAVCAALSHVLTIGMGWFGEEPGGLNRMYAGLLGSLEQAGADVCGLVAGSPQTAGPAPASLSFFARRDAPALLRLQACRRAVCSVLRAGRVDVVAAHFSLYALPVLDLLHERRFVFHFHGPWANESKAEGENGIGIVVKRTIESRVYRRADRFIVLSSAFAQILDQQYGVPRERIFIVPGGVDASRYIMNGSRRDARARLQLPIDRPLVVSVRRLIHRVGLEGLIDAMAQVRKSVPDVLLLIAGRGVLAAELARRIASRGLQDHVRLLGFVAEDDLPLLYRACDLSIVPSVALEGFGLPTIESLASGTPVLVTPVGGLPETVAGLDPGLVLPDATSDSLADAISRALRDLGRLPTPETCARYVREHFHWPVIARKVLAVYEQ
jgi:glycosyltransferase involved in cell wall biosynthesis